MVSTGVFYIKKVLTSNLIKVEQAIANNKENNKFLITDAEAINKSLEEFALIQSRFTLKSRLLIRLAELIPEGIVLNSIALTSDQYLILNGSYYKRDSLLKLKENLMDDFLSDIDFPIANLLKAEDGNFVIKGYVPSGLMDLQVEDNNFSI